MMRSNPPSIFTGVRFLAFGTVAVNAGRVLLLLVLARLLSASEFGILSLATAVVGFSSFFVDAGVSNVFYQADISDARARSTLFWLNMLLGVALAVVVALCGPLIARFYGIPGFETVLSLAAAGLVCTAMAAQHRVLLRRMMRFDVLIKIELLAFAANAALTLCGVFFGFGVYAMVAGTVLGNLVAAIAYLRAGGAAFMPGRYFDADAIRPYLGFGLYQMGERLSNFLAERADVFIIGKILGPAPLGLYDVMKQILSRPESLVNPVVAQATLPMMARKQDNLLFVRKIYLKSLELSNTLNMTVYGLVFWTAAPFLAVVTGPQWLGEADTFRWLTAYFVIHASFNPVGALLLAKGRADLGFWWNAVMLVLTPVFVWMGTAAGIAGTAQSLCWLFAGLMIPMYYFLIKPLTGATAGEYAGTFFRPLGMAAVCGLLTWPFTQIVFSSSFFVLSMNATVFLGAAFFWVKYFRKDIFRLMRKTLFC